MYDVFLISYLRKIKLLLLLLLLLLYYVSKTYITQNNSLPNGQNLNWSKFKTFADYKINKPQMMINVFGRVENIVGK